MTICMFLLPRMIKNMYYPAWSKYADEVGDYVQENGGRFVITKEGVEFTMPIKYHDFVKIKFPELKEIELCF